MLVGEVAMGMQGFRDPPVGFQFKALSFLIIGVLCFFCCLDGILDIIIQAVNLAGKEA